MLPDDSVREILIRLPDLCHVIRCASACKHWFSLAANPDFHSQFSRRHALTLTALFFQTHFDYPGGCWSEYDPNFYRIRYPDDTYHCDDDSSFKPFGDEDMIIRTTFQDSFLVSKPMPENDHFYDYTGGELPLELYLAKPLAPGNNNNSRRRRLPPPPPGIERLLGFGLVCYDGGRRFAAALFCQLPREALRHIDRHLATMHVTVFSSEAGRWSPLAWVESGQEMIAEAPVVGLDGRLYWLLTSGCVMCMDPTEAFAGGPRPRSIPPPRTVYRKYIRIGACRGKIRLAAVVRGVLKVWDLTSSYEWSLVYDKLIAEVKCRILAPHPTNSDVVFVLFDSVDVVRYDMSLHTGEIIGEYPTDVKSVRGEVSTFALCLPSSS